MGRGRFRRREEGRCFHCDGAYSPGHRCPEKNLRVIICAEEEGDLSEENGHDENEERGYPEMDLSIFSAGGLTQPHTMKLQGTVKGRTALVLIDSGASHNFISTELVSHLGLNIEATPTYTVRLGDGHKKSASSCCPEVEVQLGTYGIREKFFVFELGGVDMILGVAGLATLGK